MDNLDLLFIHHSCGGQWLADPGPDSPIATCIHTSHPNGGGLRGLLQARGYEVHEACYGSEVGDRTDIFDWPPKFRDRMAAVLSVDRNDRSLSGGRKNRIVVFKSCFPNNLLVGDGSPPGSPAGPELTLWNARAALTALLPLFEREPGVLFVYVTAPPLAPGAPPEPLWKRAAKRILGRPSAGERVARAAPLARKFNDWVKSPEGWLRGYPLPNVAAFDLFDVLTDRGASDLSRYPTGGGSDSHPSRAGNERAAREFVAFLDGAVRRALPR
jgi:hypothetical protein